MKVKHKIWYKNERSRPSETHPFSQPAFLTMTRLRPVWNCTTARNFYSYRSLALSRSIKKWAQRSKAEYIKAGLPVIRELWWETCPLGNDSCWELSTSSDMWWRSVEQTKFHLTDLGWIKVENTTTQLLQAVPYTLIWENPQDLRCL